MRKSDLCLILFFTALFATFGGMIGSSSLAQTTKVEGFPGVENFFKSDIIETGSLHVTDEKGFCRVMISARGKGAPGITLVDGDMNRRIKVGIGDGQPYINLYDDQEQVRIQTYLMKDGSPAVRFYDEAKTIDWSLPLLPQHRKQGRKWPD